MAETTYSIMMKNLGQGALPLSTLESKKSFDGIGNDNDNDNINNTNNDKIIMIINNNDRNDDENNNNNKDNIVIQINGGWDKSGL